MPLAPAPGPLGPVLADLACTYLVERRLRLPWQDRCREITPQKAAKLFERGSDRLRVELEGQRFPLKGAQQLAVLEHSLTGETARSLEPVTQLILRADCRDATTGKPISDYQAYSQLGRQQPIVVMEKGLPLTRLENTESDFQLRELKAEPSRAETVASIARAIADDFLSLPHPVLQQAPLSKAERAVVLRLGQHLPADQFEGRLRATIFTGPSTCVSLSKISATIY